MNRTLAMVGIVLASAATLSAAAPQAKPFERLDGCRFSPNKWNDGDSFHVRTTDGREIIARLYFIDAPESEIAWRDRLAEQAEYFGITIDQAATVAREAAAYTSKKLAGTFTVWTRWRDALGRSALGRVFAIVIVNGRT
jgi:endonuclease YncB( thermonuclease family)